MLDLTPGPAAGRRMSLSRSPDSDSRKPRLASALGPGPPPTERTGPFWVYSAPEGLTVWLQKRTMITERLSHLR